MQKAINIAAPTASLILFVGVAVSSKATLVVLGAYGTLFALLFPLAIFLVGNRDRWRKAFPNRAGLPIAITVFVTYPLFLVLVGLFVFVRPFGMAAKWSPTEYTSFGTWQAYGLIGIAATILLAIALSARRRRGTYRRCPYCISLIPREASRCKYCASNVEPEPSPTRIAQQHQQRPTTGAGETVIGTPLRKYPPPRPPLRPRAKTDFGQLSAPRVTGVLNPGGRTRPLPSEVDARRRQRS